MGKIATNRIKSWKKIHDLSDSDIWIYRGQANPEWNLKTTLERCFQFHNVPAAESACVENELCREFRRAYHQYSQHVPDPEDHIEWLSLMQHHGAPTRLLDFTYSIYVAAYFAIENARDECAIWAVNATWALKTAADLFRRNGANEDALTALGANIIEKRDPKVCPLFFGNSTTDAACTMNPFRLNDRLRTQKGLFLMPGNVKKPFMENLEAMPGHDKLKNVKKIIIRGRILDEARQQVFDMNITRRTLFPGLDGYAQALGVYHRAFRPYVRK